MSSSTSADASTVRCIAGAATRSYRASASARSSGRWWSALPGLDRKPSILESLGRRGEVLVRQWLEKPPIRVSPRSRGRLIYTEDHLFLGPVKML